MEIDGVELRLDTAEDCIESLKRVTLWAGTDPRRTRTAQRVIKMIKDTYTILQDQALSKRIERIEAVLANAGMSRKRT